MYTYTYAYEYMFPALSRLFRSLWVCQNTGPSIGQVTRALHGSYMYIEINIYTYIHTHT